MARLAGFEPVAVRFYRIGPGVGSWNRRGGGRASHGVAVWRGGIAVGFALAVGITRERRD
jgi:hypothetical protein